MYEMSRFEAYPMAWVDEILDELGTAKILHDARFNQGLLAHSLVCRV